jgi:hypothetical protein
MKKTYLLFLFTAVGVIAVLFIFRKITDIQNAYMNQKGEDSKKTNLQNTYINEEDIDVRDITKKEVCCESYGFGARMVKCCEKYQWTTAEECVVPEGFVGGGKQVVDGSMCQ